MLHKQLIRRIDLMTLQLFVSVHEEGTLTRGAEREMIALSAASKRMNDMEQALGIEVFERNAKGMGLTAAGETLLYYAKRILADIEKISIDVGEHLHGVRGYVRMLANISAIIEFLPEDLQAFMASHEQVKINLEERPSAGVVKGILDGVADIGICSADTEIKGLHAVQYRQDDLVVVMRPEHSLADRGRISFAETLDFDHVGLHADSFINLRTHAAARACGKPLRLRIHVPGFDAVCRMVQADLGIGVLPLKAFELIGKPLGLVSAALEDEWAKRSMLLVIRDACALSPVSRLLYEHLQGL
ncbi:LysR family transcriptional regulator [Pseudomonas sp. AFG_SD02_1510_Pfu_092]|uniref:LysR family transcriptional regulator n=1 Tax=Pseudomonas sp. AFG_SD02_1510_Pfu_092 TaxID=2259497 RepID=UPI000DEF7402|nr:LysR family transcriptional regulator [Pseudomonas sp. AFG_SD02_1510_Pfu_092]RCL29557.1 LysR family transcriptional regulator [Pseudomonas sp. AFG_SD02_1510_Pfu_092]